MLKVEGYTQEDEEKVVAFIRKVQADAVLGMAIIERAVLIKDGQEIVGMVSYGSYNGLGVIRYFLYDACIAGADLVIELFFELYKKAHEEGVKQLIAQVPSQEVEKLFAMLGFTKVTGDLSDFATLVSKDVEIMLIRLEGQST